MARDLFSGRSDLYSRYRPTYPEQVFLHILPYVQEKNRAWDCATGNGQAAVALSNYFKEVEATDISSAQLSKAIQKDNIHYSQAAAEQTPFPDNYFDLITVATAYHWLQWEGFKKEAERVARPGAVIAIWAYNLLKSGERRLDELIQWFYRDITAGWWEPERRYVDDSYATVDFNFDPLPSAEWEMELQWNREQFLGYIGSWSAVQTYLSKNQSNPVDLLVPEIEKFWKPGEIKNFTFPLFLRMGRIHK